MQDMDAGALWEYFPVPTAPESPPVQSEGCTAGAPWWEVWVLANREEKASKHWKENDAAASDVQRSAVWIPAGSSSAAHLQGVNSSPVLG